MNLLTVALVIIVVGVLLWAAQTYIPMDARVKQILGVVVIVVLILWVLQQFGILPGLSSVRLR